MLEYCNLQRQLPEQSGQIEPGASARQRVLCPGSFRRLLTVNKHCSWAFFNLCLWLRGLPGNRASISSSLNLHAVILGPHYNHCQYRLRSFPHPTEVLAASQSCRGYHFSLTALLLVVFSMSWQLKSLSVNYPTTPSDLRMKQIENKWGFDHKKIAHQIHVLSFRPIFSEHLQGFQVNEMTLDLL